MTLVEVMMAMFVLIAVLGGVLSSVVRAAALTRDSKVVYRETAIANDLVERMRSMTFSELKTELESGNIALGITVKSTNPYVTAGTVPSTASSGTGTGPVLAGTYAFHWERTCRDITADPLRVAVEVWPERLEAKKITVVTYISASGLINK